MQIKIKHGIATGVYYNVSGQGAFVKATKEVILSAGAVMSPFILMHSGIGPASHLREMGVSRRFT